MTVTRLPNAKTIPDDCIGGPELARRSGLTYRQVDYWTRTRVLHAVNPEHGTGAARYYPATELPFATLLRHLVDAGFLPNHAHHYARELLAHGHTTIAGITVHLPEEL